MSLSEFTNKVKKRLMTKQDTKVIVVGGTGHGKSTWSIKLCRAVARDCGLTFDPSKHIVFYAKDLVKVFDENERSCIIMDDAGYQADRQKWYTKTAWAIKIILETTRIKQNFFVLNLPFLKLLPDETIALTNYIFDVKFQGKAFFQVIHPNFSSEKYTHWKEDLGWFFAFDHLDESQDFKDYVVKKLAFIHENSGKLDKQIDLENITFELDYLKKKNRLIKESTPSTGGVGGRMAELKSKLATTKGEEWKAAMREYQAMKSSQ